MALTFDDGPGRHTEDVVRALERAGGVGTFFVLGSEIDGREDALKLIAGSGSEIGNHSMNHSGLPDAEEIAAASDRIEAATGVAPALFRPPGGHADEALVVRAAVLGLATVRWDVDPEDWGLPGAEAIRERVASAVRPGSIVVMHDGGGDRSQTVAALPGIVEDLRERGLGLATVSELLALAVDSE